MFLKDLNDMDILDLSDKYTSDKMYNKFHKYYYLWSINMLLSKF